MGGLNRPNLSPKTGPDARTDESYLAIDKLSRKYSSVNKSMCTPLAAEKGEERIQAAAERLKFFCAIYTSISAKSNMLEQIRKQPEHPGLKGLV